MIDIQPFYFFYRAKALLVDQLAYDLNNEFYHEQRRADFAHVRNDADVFAEKMKKIMMPYLKMPYRFGFLDEGDLPDVRKGIDYTNIELEMENIISNFRHNLNKIDYKSRGYQASPLAKIDLLLKVFEVIAVMQKDGKIGKKSRFNDFLKWNFLKEHNISMPGLYEIKTEYEKLVLKINETVGENQNPETDTYQLCIHSYLELMLLEIYRFFERKPTVAVCSNCKKIFVGESGKRIYCPYPFEGTKTCADMGSNIARNKKKSYGDEIYDKIRDRLRSRCNSKASMQTPEIKEKWENEFHEWKKYADIIKCKFKQQEISEEKFIESMEVKYKEVTRTDFK